MTQTREDEALLDKALASADRVSWQAFSLKAFAREIDMPLAKLHLVFPTKNHLLNAWFDQAKVVGLKQALGHQGDSYDCIAAIIQGWLEHLARHKHLTRQMIRFQLQPGQLHRQLAELLRIHDFTQAIVLNLADKPKRLVIKKVALGLSLVSIFIAWLLDNSEEQKKALAILKYQLKLGRLLSQGRRYCKLRLKGLKKW